MIYLKQAATTPETDHQDVRDLVQVMLARIAISGEEAVRDYSRTFDKWSGDIIVSQEHLKAAADQVPERLKEDIRFAHANIRRFAESEGGDDKITCAGSAQAYGEFMDYIMAI